MSTKTIIRPIEEKDFKVTAIIISQAFAGKMPLLKKYSEEEVADFMLAGGIFDKGQLEGYYVAERDQQVKGVMRLDTWQQRKKRPQPTKRLMYLFGHFGPFKVIFSALGVMLLEEKLSQDEMWLEYLAVDRNERGNGIGNELIDFGEEAARHTPGIKRYTLGVIGENHRALKLYQRKGFIIHKSKSSRMLEWLTGVDLYHMLEKDLEQSEIKKGI